MMELTARPFRRDDDFVPLVELHNTVEQAAGRPATLTDERLRRALDVPHLYRWVVDASGGEIAGYAVLY